MELEVDSAKCLSEDRGTDREEEVVWEGKLMIKVIRFLKLRK